MSNYSFFNQEDIEKQIEDLMREKNGSVEDLERELRTGYVEQLQDELKRGYSK